MRGSRLPGCACSALASRTTAIRPAALLHSPGRKEGRSEISGSPCRDCGKRSPASSLTPMERPPAFWSPSSRRRERVETSHREFKHGRNLFPRQVEPLHDSSMVAPASRFSNTMETGMRVSLKTHAPLTLPGGNALHGGALWPIEASRNTVHLRAEQFVERVACDRALGDSFRSGRGPLRTVPARLHAHMASADGVSRKKPIIAPACSPRSGWTMYEWRVNRQERPISAR